MSTVSGQVRRVTPEEATWLLAADPVGNVELLCALRYDHAIQCIGVVRGGALAGVLVAAQEDGDNALTARFEAADDAALAPLIAACPPDARRIVVHRAWMLPALTTAFSLIPEQMSESVFFATATIALPASPTVRLLTIADAGVVAVSATMGGGKGFLDALAQGFRPFGVLTDDRLIAHAIAANATDWTEEVMSVWTAPRVRGRGLATAVVATTAADILRRNRTAIYVAAVTNLASQRVAVKTGFQRAYETLAYRRLR